MFCQNCGKEIAENAVVCVHCGSAIQNENPNGKSFIATLLLVLFTGGIGMHRFYTGHVATGIFQLLLTLSFIGLIFSMPWVFIDFIMILAGKFKTKNGDMLR